MASSSVHSIRKTKPGSRFIKSHPMKKLYPFFLIMLCMAGAVALSSCSDDDSSSSGDPDMPESGNALICNGVVREIKSAVYTVETPGNGEKADVPEAAPVYTIYLSPTAGLVDADGMLIADDAVKITVKQPSGAVDLTAAGNGIVYGEIDVNSSNVGGSLESGSLGRVPLGPRRPHFRRNRNRRQNADGRLLRTVQEFRRFGGGRRRRQGGAG